MQGPGLSSEARWTPFHSQSTADVRNPVGRFRVSWLRAQDPGAAFATVGTSLVSSTDIIQGSGETTIVNSDLFQYYDETDYVMRLEYDREVEEPLGGLSHGMLDVVFDNNTNRFSQNVSGTIGTALLPDRPMKADIGFRLAGINNPGVVFAPEGIEVTVPIMRAQSKTRVFEDFMKNTAMVSGYDYIHFIEQSNLTAATYEDMRADEIIASILSDLGFGSSQYELDTSLNTIPFAWFPADQKAGSRIRKLCEAEEAHFYQDEEGILRFETRRHLIESPHNTSVHTIDWQDILLWEEDANTKIINRCVVKSRPREIQPTQVVWLGQTPLELQPSESKIVWARFTDELGVQKPVKTLTTPVASTDFIANTLSDGSGVDTSASVTVDVVNFIETARLTITNNYSAKVYLTTLQLRGDAAEVTQAIEERYDDTDSQGKYEIHQLVVENDFIQESSFAAYLAQALVNKYANPLRKYRMTIRGLPHLQLKDRVTVKDLPTGTNQEFRVLRIQGLLDTTQFLQTIWLREITEFETEDPAVVGVTVVGGDEVVWI